MLSETASVNNVMPLHTDWGSSHDDVERLVEKIEEMQVDITANYDDWVKCGFAIASEFGEAGREYFLRISRFYPTYSAKECNRKYNDCLRGRGYGITIKTLFYLAKEAGVLIKENIYE